MRTIRIHQLGQVDSDRLVEPAEEKAALQYLATWAAHIGQKSESVYWDQVDIYPSQGRAPDDFELLAVYKKTVEGEKPRHVYTIGAVYRPEERRFTYHS